MNRSTKATVVIDKTELRITGRLFRTARLRHEWFEFLEDPSVTIARIRKESVAADVVTFLVEPHKEAREYPFYRELASASILNVCTFEDWWKKLDFKVRNKVRKAQKNGVELRYTQLDDALVSGVKAIYDESPVRQGRKFLHYAKTGEVIKRDLSSFPECTFFVGAYLRDELIGFMKLFEGDNILRTVHIIAKLNHRDKAVQDSLIAKAVEICAEKKIDYLHYGDWTSGGLGAFRIKHGFQRVDYPRYFVPLSSLGKLMLRLNLHHNLKDQLPEHWVENLLALRNRWNSWKYKQQVTNVS